LRLDNKHKSKEMNILSVVTQMVVLFFIVIVGFASHKLKLLGGDFDKKLSNFVIQVTCPCLIIASTMGDTMPDRSHIPALLGIGVITYVVLNTVAWLLPKVMPVAREERGMYSFMLAYANVGFIGYPIVASLFGHSAVFYACILNAPGTLAVFVWGVMFITGQKTKGFNWRLLVSPAMISTYVSIVIVATGWHAPTFIAQPMTLIGNMTVPAALLVIGSSIAGMPAKRMMGSRGTYVMCLFRLLLIPVGMFYLMELLGFDSHISAINAVVVGMPVASYGTMFCLKYGKDETVMAQGTFLSTLLSVLSIPLLSMIIA